VKIVTTEWIAQMAPMLVLAGVTVAWLAQLAWTARGYGFLPDMALGLGGSVLIGALVGTVAAADVGMLAVFAIGGIGAVLAIVAQRGLWRSSLAGA
jgi:hypothetical protein